jgi:hypothetical protein
LSYFQSPTGAEQHRVGFLGQLERGFGQRMAVRLVGGAADQAVSISNVRVEHVEDADRPRRRFRCRCRHREDCDFHERR